MYKLDIKANNIKGEIMLVKDICSKEVITIDILADLKEASRMMKINNIGFLPVTQDGEIVGVITDRDIVIYGLANERKYVKDIMRQKLIKIDAHATLKEALKVLEKEQVKRLLVYDNKCFAVLSLSDIIKSEPKGLNTKIYETIKGILKDDVIILNPEVDTFIL